MQGKFFLIVLLLLNLLIFNEEHLCTSALQDATSQLADIGEIEEKIFHEKYEKELLEERLTRLEEFIFKTTYKDGSYDQRIKKIKDALVSKENRNKGFEQIENQALDKTSLEKTNLQIPEKNFKKDSQSPIQIRTYLVDPNTGFLINEPNGEIVRDSHGNQIKVNIPVLQAPIFNPPSANQFNHYPPLPSYPNIKQPSAYPNQVPPLDLLLNQYGYNQDQDY